MDEFMTRAQLVKLQHDRVVDQHKAAAVAGDSDRADALMAKSALLLDQLRAIREEQLISMLPKRERPEPEKRRWWRLGR